MFLEMIFTFKTYAYYFRKTIRKLNMQKKKFTFSVGVQLIILLYAVAFITYHIAYELGKFQANVENQKQSSQQLPSK